MERPAYGTLPPLPPLRILENVREQFAALRGSGPPARLLVDVRPHGDQRHHFEGAISVKIGAAPDEHRRLLGVGEVAEGEGRSVVRAWLYAMPSTQDGLLNACTTTGSRLREVLIDGGLVGETMLPASLLWPAALARLCGGALRLTRLDDVDFVVPEAGVPTTGPLAPLYARLVGAEFTPDRLFVIEDVVETSIVLVDRLIEGLPKTTGGGTDSAGGAGGERGEGRRTKGKRRGKARQSVDVDALLLRLVKAISKRCRDEDVESFLVREVYSKGSTDLSEMLRDHLAEDVSPQTIRRKAGGKGSPHASKLYAKWSRFRTTAGGEASDRDDDVQRNSAPMSDRDAQVDEMLRSGVVTKRASRRA